MAENSEPAQLENKTDLVLINNPNKPPKYQCRSLLFACKAIDILYYKRKLSSRHSDGVDDRWNSRTLVREDANHRCTYERKYRFCIEP